MSEQQNFWPLSDIPDQHILSGLVIIDDFGVKGVVINHYNDENNRLSLILVEWSDPSTSNVRQTDIPRGEFHRYRVASKAQIEAQLEGVIHHDVKDKQEEEEILLVDLNPQNLVPGVTLYRDGEKEGIVKRLQCDGDGKTTGVIFWSTRTTFFSDVFIDARDFSKFKIQCHHQLLRSIKKKLGIKVEKEKPTVVVIVSGENKLTYYDTLNAVLTRISMMSGADCLVPQRSFKFVGVDCPMKKELFKVLKKWPMIINSGLHLQDVIDKISSFTYSILPAGVSMTFDEEHRRNNFFVKNNLLWERTGDLGRSVHMRKFPHRLNASAPGWA